jgi:hypothetical protein
MSKLDDLEQLGRLRADGGITDAEFERRKRAILEEPTTNAGLEGRRRSVIIAAGLLAIGLAIAALLWSALPSSPSAGVPEAASSAHTSSAEPEAATPKFDLDAEVWDVQLDSKPDDSRCVARHRKLGDNLRFTFHTDTGFVDLHAYSTEAIEPKVTSVTPSTGTITFYPKKTRIRTLGTVAPHTIDVFYPDGISFFVDHLGAGESFNYKDQHGTNFDIELEGRSDLMRDLLACLKRAESLTKTSEKKLETVTGRFGTPAKAQDRDLRHLQAVAILNGNCTQLSFAGKDATRACVGKITNTMYKTGRTGFVFMAGDLAVITFSGADNPAQGDQATVRLDKVIFTLVGTGTEPNVIPATGNCRYTNPYAGPSRITCSASTKDGKFSGAFVSDGAEPDIKEF